MGAPSLPHRGVPGAPYGGPLVAAASGGNLGRCQTTEGPLLLLLEQQVLLLMMMLQERQV